MEPKNMLKIYWTAAGFFGILCIAGIPLGLLLIFLSGSWAGFVPGIALSLLAGGIAGHLGGLAVDLEQAIREEQMPYRFVGDCLRNSPHSSSKR